MTNSLVQIIPRVIRLRDAPLYLGMDRNRFNLEVRPNIGEIKIGTQGVAFDRLDLDEWFDHYKSRNGRPSQQPQGEMTWEKEKHLGSLKEKKSGTSTNRSGVDAFAKALAKANSR